MRLLLFAVCTLLLLAQDAAAQVIKPINETLPTGWNSPTSGPYTMGYIFNTSQSDVLVEQMGCCQHDGLAKTMWLWDSTSQAAPIATIQTAASPAGTWRWGTLTTPVQLVANRNYVVTVDATTYYFTPKSSVPAAFTPTGTINYVDNVFPRLLQRTRQAPISTTSDRLTSAIRKAPPSRSMRLRGARRMRLQQSLDLAETALLPPRSNWHRTTSPESNSIRLK